MVSALSLSIRIQNPSLPLPSWTPLVNGLTSGPQFPHLQVGLKSTPDSRGANELSHVQKAEHGAWEKVVAVSGRYSDSYFGVDQAHQSKPGASQHSCVALRDASGGSSPAFSWNQPQLAQSVIHSLDGQLPDGPCLLAQDPPPVGMAKLPAWTERGLPREQAYGGCAPGLERAGEGQAKPKPLPASLEMSQA